MAKYVNKGYHIKLSPKEYEALGFIADRYEYGAALYNNIEEVGEGSEVYWISESDAWNWKQAADDEDGWMSLAGGKLLEAMQELYESIE